MQASFSDLEYAGKKKQTRRDRCLAQLDALTPWAALVAAIEPFYPQGRGAGRPADRPCPDAADVRGAAVLRAVG